MFDKWKNLSIGILATTAIGLVVWVLMFLHPSFGDGGKLLRVRFPNVDKVGVGTRVTYAGRPVGEVISMRMLPEERGKDRNEMDPIFAYELTLAIDSNLLVYASDDIQIRTSGLMGEKNIAITPKNSKDGNTRLLDNNDQIFATIGGSVEDTFQGLNNVAKKAEKTLDELSVLLDKNQTHFQQTFQAIEASSLQVEAFIKRANELDIAGNMVRLLQSANDSFTKLDHAIAKIENEKLIEAVAQAASNLKQLSDTVKNDTLSHINEAALSLTSTLKSANNVLVTVANQNGSIGKMLYSDDFYLKTQGVMAKLDTMMTDINHYGMLFHLDKSWQRERRRRMVELEQLRTASEFKSYLNNELNRITTSVARVGVALDHADTTLAKTEDPNINPRVAKNIKQEFLSSYNELLGQLQMLEATLKIHGSDSIAESSEEINTP